MTYCFDLTGRTAIVTGAGRGIGRAIALALAEAGADIAIGSRTPEEIEKVGAEIRALGRKAIVVPTDVSDRAQVNRLVDESLAAFGKIDILVNNPGLKMPKPAFDVTDEEWDYAIRTVLYSQWYCSQAVGRHMADQKYGKIINLGSTWGMIGIANNAPYSIGKGAVLHLTRVLAVEWAKHGIRVNAINPSYCRTSINEQELADPKILQIVLSRIPLKYIAETSDIAPAAVYLASPASDYITGQMLVIDGGMTAI